MLAAAAAATADAVLKAGFGARGAVCMAMARSVAPALILWPGLFFLPHPPLRAAFWSTVAALVPLEVLALVLYMRAIRASPLSLTLPMLAFTPVFVLLSGWAILGERPGAVGAAGVVVTVAGAYILNLGAVREGWLAPWRRLGRSEGPRLMLLVAAVYAVTSVLGKRAVLLAAPFFFACFYFVLLGVVVPVLLWPLARREARGAPAPFPWKAFWGVGFCQAAMVLGHMWAIHLAPAAYMIAVKRTSLLFGVLYGRFWFGETDLGERLSGAALMLAGVVVIAAAHG
nr:DMT family transporter [Dissulfurirhabdus thermomarina]